MLGAKQRLRVVCRASPLPRPVLDDLEAAFDVAYAPPDAATATLPDADALLVTVDSRLDALAIRDLPSGVEAIATYSVGLDHLDLQAAKARGLAVFNTPGVLASSVAETALLLVLGAARRLTESIALVRGGTWPGWTACQLNGTELAGKTLAILGMGEIGRAIAQRARGFGMEIAYSNRRRLDPAAEGGATYVPDPDALIRLADVLVLAAPSTEATRGFLSARRLRLARSGLIVVNVARGDLVVDDDLIEALRSGQVGAAGLDVLNNEPRFDARYLELPNVVLLPHIGSSTVEARRRMGLCLVRALEAWRLGERPPNRVV
jgi:glyoxylate reductase